jgi:c-di-AMP phosphodiesterase-like protein
MKDIHEVLRRKQTKYAQLVKQIELLQQAVEKLREVAPLLAENEEEEDNVVLGEVEEELHEPNVMVAQAAAGQADTQTAPPKPRGVAPRWP